MKNNIIIGTRGSRLALWQARFIGDMLKKKHQTLQVEYKTITTKGDKILNSPLEQIPGKGLFTKELENELLTGAIDIAVHSFKDIPTELPDGLTILGVTERGPAADVLLTHRKEYSLNTLPIHAKVATGSVRRKAQLLWWRPDFIIPELRGNITTRIQKFLDSDWHGIVLAKAGLERLELTGMITHEFTLREMLPAVGQGALAIEGRSDDSETAALVTLINHDSTRRCITAERSFLKTLGGGCKTPIAAYCTISRDTLTLEGLVGSPDGKQQIRETLNGSTESPEKLGMELAQILIDKGAKTLLTY